MENIKTIKATTHDITQLQKIGRETFSETFSENNTEENMKSYLEKGFSDERLSDSVNNLIDNFQYPNPTLANILSFDRKVKILDYNQVCTLIGKHEATFNDFSKIYIDEKMFYVRKSEKEFYKIPDRL